MPNGIYVQLLPNDAAERLRALVAKSKGPALRKGLRKQGSFMLKRTKENIGSNVHGRTGALRRSMGLKVKVQTTKSKAFAAIFARKGFTVPDAYAKGVVHNPVNISHLVEYGHGGPRPAGEHPFMRPALDTYGLYSVGFMEVVLREELAK